MKRNYYFVRTPLQYLNALEAKNNALFKAKEHHLILLSDFHRTISQLEEIVEKHHWISVNYPWKAFSKSKNNPFFNAINVFKRKLRLDTILSKIKATDAVFWGNIHANWFFYLCKKTASTIYILDDGFVTINTLKKVDLKEIKATLLSSKVGKIERFILKINYEIDWDKLYFFTNFNTDSNVQKTIIHDYSFLSQQFKLTNLTKSIYFIGQPLIFQRMMKKEVYISLVESIFKYYKAKGLNCFYVPHRSTTIDYIPNHWQTKTFNKPIESILFDEEIEKPQLFASFYSSALYNIAMMDKNSLFKFDYWQFDKKDLLNVPIEKINEALRFVQSQARENVTIRHKSLVDA
jgi:hypothetical protein